jgi:hypothetical protein
MTIRKETWANTDGLVVGNGTRQVEGQSASVTGRYGAQSQMIIDFNFDGIATTYTDLASAASAAKLDAGAYIVDATVHITTAFSGGTGTDLQVGTYDWEAGGDGTVASIATNDPDAIATTTNITHSAVGSYTGTGVEVGAVTTAADGTIIAVTSVTGDFTAGQGYVVINYIPPQ